MAISKEQIMLALQEAMLGEIYNNIRAIVFKYDPKNKLFILRYYLDREPIMDDYDNIGIVIAEFLAYFKYSDFDHISQECIYTDNLISQIDVMDGIVYCRKE
jgi:hypothetical protein